MLAKTHGIVPAVQWLTASSERTFFYRHTLVFLVTLGIDVVTDLDVGQHQTLVLGVNGDWPEVWAGIKHDGTRLTESYLVRKNGEVIGFKPIAWVELDYLSRCSRELYGELATMLYGVEPGDVISVEFGRSGAARTVVPGRTITLHADDLR